MLFEHAAIELLRRTVIKDGYIDLPSMGDSMYPLIKQGDICRFCDFEQDSLQKGDIVLYWSEKGRLVAHRLVKIVYMPDKVQYLFKGDSNLGYDRPVNEGQVMGKLALIKRGDKSIMIENSFFYIWGKMILFFPIISGLLRNYLNKRNIFQY